MSAALLAVWPNLHAATTPRVSAALSLEERARRNYPDSEYLQREWIRAVRVVRATKRGYVLDLHPLPPAGQR